MSNLKEADKDDVTGDTETRQMRITERCNEVAQFQIEATREMTGVLKTLS